MVGTGAITNRAAAEARAFDYFPRNEGRDRCALDGLVLGGQDGSVKPGGDLKADSGVKFWDRYKVPDGDNPS